MGGIVPKCGGTLGGYEAKLLLDPVTPIGTRRASGFASFTDGTSGAHEWEEAIYPPHPEGREFAAFRIALGMSLRETARRLGVNPSEVSGLEFGRFVPRDGWDALRARLYSIDPRPRCIRCGARWVPNEGVDATVVPCAGCSEHAQGEGSRR
jgi:hypothetical protein